MQRLVTMHERGVFIVEYLRQQGDNPKRTIRDIWEAATRPKGDGPDSGLGDEASLPTYHRTIAKLVRSGQLEEEGQNSEGAVLHRVAPQLSPLSTYTLTDLNAALWELSAPEALATYIDAIDYFESRAEQVLGKAAQLLLKEDPRALVLRMLKDLAEELCEDAEILKDPKAADSTYLSQTNQRLRRLHQLVNGELGISAKTWRFPTFEQMTHGEPFSMPDWNAVSRALEGSVYGSAFIETIDVSEGGEFKDVVAGSDGSSHAGYVRGIRAPQYVEEEGRLTLVFNNSLAYIEMPKQMADRHASPYHGVPLTRAALEDPQNRGMILSRPWFQDLSDSQYEHTKKAALDVVQYRVDERLMTGLARALGTKQASVDGSQLPRPNLLIRDGTVTPQEREFQHYCADNSYGDVVKEGIKLSYRILREVMDSNRRVYAGSVKFTVLRTFSAILNWFIKKHVDSSWDLSRVSVVNDPVAMTRLFNTLPATGEGKYYRSCIIVRPFPAMVTDLRSVPAESPAEWRAHFKKRQERQLADYRDGSGPPPWFSSIEVEDDDYVRLCELADYGSFFFGKPGGDPQITVPRFEFMDSLRALAGGVEARRERVERSSRMIVSGVHHTKWQLDRDHNFMTGAKIPRMVPFVVYEAHEKCKALGHKLESELRQAIAARLSQIKGARGLSVPKVEIEPVLASKYLESVRRLLGPKSNDEDSKNESK